MTEKRFKYKITDGFFDGDVLISIKEVVDLLNEQQATIQSLEEEIKLLKPTNIEQYEQIVQLQQENEQLQAQLREKEQDEQLYANEILELREANKEFIQFKELGGDY